MARASLHRAKEAFKSIRPVMIIPLLIGLGGLASFAISAKQGPGATSAGDAMAIVNDGRETRVLYSLPYEEGGTGLSRLYVRLPSSVIESIRSSQGRDGQKILLQELRERVRGLGVEQVMLATQDPSDPTIFKVVTRGAPLRQTDGVISVVQSEVIQPDIKRAQRVMNARVAPLDLGMSKDEQATFEETLIHELNARHLRGVATSYEPHYAVSGSVLRAKADLIDRRIAMTPERSVGLLEEAWTPADTNPEGAKEAQAFAATLPAPDLARDIILDAASTFLCGYKPDNAKAFRIARFIIRELPSDSGPTGIFMLCPYAVRAMFEPTGDEGYVSPSALEYVLAETKPVVAGTVDPSIVHKRMQKLAAEPDKDPSVLRAKAQVEKARRAIERRRWIEWTRRQYVAG